MILKSLSSAILGFSLAGCIAMPKMQNMGLQVAPVSEYQSIPQVGELSTASVGEPLLHQGFAVINKAIDVDNKQKIILINIPEGVPGDYRGGFHYPVGPQRRLEILSSIELFGKYPLVSENEINSFYGFKLGRPNNILIQINKVTGATCYVWFNFESCPDVNFVLKHKKSEIVEYTLDKVQQTLYYNGRVGNKINVGYREFYGDSARTAFSNNVEYDYSAGGKISYKGASIIVVSADNEKIVYKVIKNFPSM